MYGIIFLQISIMSSIVLIELAKYTLRSNFSMKSLRHVTACFLGGVDKVMNGEITINSQWSNTTIGVGDIPIISGILFMFLLFS